MKASSLSLAIAVLALSSGAAFADGTSSNLTRADVAQSVLAARAAGQLRPAGEADRDWLVDTNTASATSRDEVRQGVAAARAAGQLRLAGEADEERLSRSATDSSSYVLSRADVKAETLRARDDGTLLAAGEGYDDRNQSSLSSNMPSSRVAYAHVPHLFSFLVR
jgi:hypothetical protein